MRKMIRRYMAAFVFTIGAALLAMGTNGVDYAPTLTLCVEWFEGFTGHVDGIAGAAVMAEVVAPAISPQIAEQIETLNKNFTRTFNDLEPKIKALEEKALGTAELKEEVAKIAKSTAETIDTLAKLQREAIEAQKAAQARQDEFETKFASRDPRSTVGPAAGEAFEKAYKEKSFNSNQRGRVEAEFDTKAITNAAGSGADLLAPQYLPGVIGPPQRALRMRDLIPVGDTTSTSIIFMKELAVTNNVAVQATQGAAKGQSNFTFVQDSEPVITVAHYVKISRQMLDDIAYIRSYLDGRMRFLLMQEEDRQILNGTGTNQLNGIKTQATAFNVTLDTAAGVTNQQNLDVIRLAILQVSLAEYAADGIILHPTDWGGIELLKNSQQNYIFANPASQIAPRLWGLPVVATTGQPVNKFTVGAFALGAQLWQRQTARAMISTENEDDFIKNMATMLAELRETLTVYRPASFVDGDFTTAKA